ncbi:hypothetical protein JHD50_01125 [Sulfurimonas sp. MAG313]|nr:hypothetical protein [Sulfurimonas sp. MAG313]MDF1879913.1 hypothetical protein [Sulfurimonas sp. MAG313]
MFSWFLSFFASKKSSEIYHFGRFITYKKTAKQDQFYQASKKAFLEQRYVQGYEYYFKFLHFYDEHGQDQGNITCTREVDSLHFKIIQGSAVIHGVITQRHLKATVNLAHTLKDNIAVMRRLLEKNYMYTYSSFYLQDETLKSKIYFDNVSLSPQKKYFFH